MKSGSEALELYLPAAAEAWLLLHQGPLHSCRFSTQPSVELCSVKDRTAPSSRKRRCLACQPLATWNGTLFCRVESTVEKGCTCRKSSCSAVKHVKNGKRGSGLITGISLCVGFPFGGFPPLCYIISMFECFISCLPGKLLLY